MSSVLGAVKTAWAADSELVALVPGSRVFLGPPNPGSALTCVGLASETQRGLIHTSTNQYVRIEVEALAQAETEETLETLADKIRQRLHTWESTRFRAIRLASITARIERSEDSPIRHWVGRFNLEYDAVRL